MIRLLSCPLSSRPVARLPPPDLSFSSTRPNSDMTTATNAKLSPSDGMAGNQGHEEHLHSAHENGSSLEMYSTRPSAEVMSMGNQNQDRHSSLSAASGDMAGIGVCVCVLCLCVCVCARRRGECLYFGVCSISSCVVLPTRGTDSTHLLPCHEQACSCCLIGRATLTSRSSYAMALVTPF